MKAKEISGLVVAGCLLFSPIAHSALVASLQFKDPVGTASPADAIPVWVTLTLAEESDPLIVDNGAGYPFGFPSSFIPSRAFGGASFASYTSVLSYSTVSCRGSFTDTDCRSEIYEFDVNFGDDSFHRALRAGSMAPGESRDFLFGAFTPSDAVPLGDYILFNAGFGFIFYGLDALGNEVSQSVDLATTCRSFSPDCAFTRTVVSDVPLPAAGVLFLGALGLLGGATSARRRRS